MLKAIDVRNDIILFGHGSLAYQHKYAWFIF